MDESRLPPYPIALDLQGKPVVVVGAGQIAERKVRGLLEAGAALTVIAPRAVAALGDAAAAGRLRYVARAFEESDLADAFLVFAATDDAALNARVTAAARARGILVNDTSDATHSDFATALVHRAGRLTFTIDTSGLSPSFALRVRDELQERFGSNYAAAAEALGRARAYVTTVVPAELRAPVMKALAARPIDELAALDPGRAENDVDAIVERMSAASGGGGPLATAVCATRASALAMWQTRHVMAKLASAGIVSTVLQISTKGDRIQDRSLAALGSDSIFVKELELALREGRADYAVHSCKDLPSTLPADMSLVAIGPREDPRDAFCSERFPSFEALPHGARVGTSSPRRRAQLQALRPDLVFETIRGNVDTRLRKLREGEYDAIVLASAGLRRLGLRATFTDPLDPDVVTPAVGQGALAIECRAEDPLGERIHAVFADRATELAVTAERAYLRTFRAGCQAPVGAYGTFSGDTLELRGVVATLDGSRVLRRATSATVTSREDAEALGTGLAQALLADGGAELLAANEALLGPLHGRIFLLPRTQERPSQIGPALRGAGAEVIEAADSAQALGELAGRTPHALLFPSSGSVRAVTEYLTSLRDNGARPVVAAMGASSSEAARAAGFPPDVIAPEPTIAAFVQSVTHYVLEGTGS
jgi:hydroxymethylbilane synthase